MNRCNLMRRKKNSEYRQFQNEQNNKMNEREREREKRRKHQELVYSG